MQALVGTISDIVSELMTAYRQGRAVNMLRLKQDAAAKNRLQGVPKLTQIIAGVPEQYKKQLLPLLKAKPVRTASGIAVVAVMSKPHRCPHIAMTGGVCVYCPGGPDSDFEYSTQSYTGYEPTSMRAIRARYDPFLQTKSRVDQLQKLGHSTDKVEFILMGGTFMSLDIEYRDWFIRNLHDALSGHTSSSVSEAIQYSEQSNSKCIGITIETRPDYCLKPHLSNMLTYGCTRLEIGVQVPSLRCRFALLLWPACARRHSCAHSRDRRADTRAPRPAAQPARPASNPPASVARHTTQPLSLRRAPYSLLLLTPCTLRHAERLRRRGARHKPRPHGARRQRVLPPREGRGLQDRGPHDARSAQRRLPARHAPVSRIL